jgi:Leucine-rich repeat (LRR) protein
VVTKEGVVKIDLPGERAAPAPSLPMVPPSVRDIAAQLVKLNPDFDGQLEPTLNGDAVVALRLTVDQVKDVSPLKTLTTLRNLSCTGSTMGSGQLADLSPLSGLKLQVLNVSNTQVSNLAPLKGMPLESLSCANTKVADLAPLAGMPLAHLQLQWTQVTSLTPLRDSPLVDLNICGTRVTDLAPVRNMKLDSFYCDATRIADLSPLTGMPLKNLNWRGYDQTNPRHQQVVKSLETLESIDSVPTQEFWREVEAKQINATP